jgi:hypothetical protein
MSFPLNPVNGQPAVVNNINYIWNSTKSAWNRSNATALVISNTIAATSSTTGALRVTGGVGVLGNVYVSGGINGVIGNGTAASGTFTTLTATSTVNLGSNTNVTITGGTSGQFLRTNGSGGLSWATVTGGSGVTGAKYTSSATPPIGPAPGDEWYDTTSDILFLYINDGTNSTWVDVSSAAGYGSGSSSGGGGIGLSTRVNKTINLTSVGINSSVNITIADGFKSYMLLQVYTSVASWVRVYTDTTSRTNDASRDISVDPTIDSGVLVEAVTIGAQTLNYSPAVLCYTADGSNNVLLNITNKSGSVTNMTVTLTLLQLEV